MQPERWRKIEQLCFQALELQGEQRTEFLESHCKGDPELLNQITSLLELESETTLSEPLVRLESNLFGSESDPEHRIGPYRIIRSIASGGMGVVYLAVRSDNQFERSAALKVIRNHLHSDESVSRFYEERQILANLNHPNIARLFDGGTTEEGMPWFAMEYIEGIPITDYCERSNLPLKKRIRLFLDVCEAVMYAHQNLIVHRDLKPANILVTDTGKPVLLDFGIARLTGIGFKNESNQEQNRILTPDYASPEQIRGEGASTVSDIYSLGVLFYEMLTGTVPYRIGGKGARAVVSEIDDIMFEPPSLRSGRSELCGDLDSIILKALEKKPESRYRSVDQLTSDLHAYLNHFPVSAREQRSTYLAGKFFRRHKVGTAVSSLILVLVMTFALIAYQQSIEIQRQAEVARSERDRAEEVSSFLADLFASTDPSEAQSVTLTARELLRRGAARIENDLREQPLLQASLYQVVSDVYESMGLYEEGIEMASNALDIRQELHGEVHVEIAASMNALGWLYRQTGNYDRSDSLLRASLHMRRDLLGDDDLNVARSLNDLGVLHQTVGNLASADTLLAEALEIRMSQLGRNHESVGVALSNYAALKWRMGDMGSAESMMQEVVELLGPPDEPADLRLAVALTNLAAIQLYRGDTDGPEELYRRALDIRLQLVGEEHQDVAYSMAHLGNLLRMKKNYAEAEEYLRKSLELRINLLGGDHMLVGDSHRLLADLFRDWEDHEQAEFHINEAITVFDTVFPEGHIRTAQVLQKLGEIYYQTERAREAIPPLKRAMDIRSSVFGDDDLRTIESMVWLGAITFDIGEVAKSIPFLEAGLKAIEQYGIKAPELQKMAETRLEMNE